MPEDPSVEDEAAGPGDCRAALKHRTQKLQVLSSPVSSIKVQRHQAVHPWTYIISFFLDNSLALYIVLALLPHGKGAVTSLDGQCSSPRQKKASGRACSYSESPYFVGHNHRLHEFQTQTLVLVNSVAAHIRRQIDTRTLILNHLMDQRIEIFILNHE